MTTDEYERAQRFGILVTLEKERAFSLIAERPGGVKHSGAKVVPVAIIPLTAEGEPTEEMVEHVTNIVAKQRGADHPDDIAIIRQDVLDALFALLAGASPT